MEDTARRRALHFSAKPLGFSIFQNRGAAGVSVSQLLWAGPQRPRPSPEGIHEPVLDPRGTNRKANNPQFPVPSRRPASAEAARPRLRLLKPSPLLAAVEPSQVRQREPLSTPGRNLVCNSAPVAALLFIFSLSNAAGAAFLQLFFSSRRPEFDLFLARITRF